MGAGNVDATTTLDVRLQLLILKETWLTSRYVQFANYLPKQSAFEKTSIPEPRCTVIFLEGRKHKGVLLCYRKCHYENTVVRTVGCPCRQADRGHVASQAGVPLISQNETEPDKD